MQYCLYCLKTSFLVNFWIGYFESFLSDGVRPNVTKLNSQPKGVTSSSDGGIVIVACNSGIDVFINQKEAALHKTSYEATCVSLCADKKYVVVGGQVWFYMYCLFRIFTYTSYTVF